MDILLKRADGTGEAVPVVGTEEWKELATDWSTDGKYILYDRAGDDARNQIWYLQRSEGGTFEPSALLASEFDQRAAQLSPDGRYVAYVSNESGSYEVYVAIFPKADRKWQVSYDGGNQPTWAKGGEELYYVNEYTLHAVSVSYEPDFSPGSPEQLFQAMGFGGSFQRRYDVSADGRFLVKEPVRDTPPSIRVVQNWFAQFKER